MTHVRQAKFQIGQIVRHRLYPFRGVIFDVDPEFANTEEWWLSIPENVRPKQGPAVLPPARRKRREHLHCIRLGAELSSRRSGEPISHPQVDEIFVGVENGCYRTRRSISH